MRKRNGVVWSVVALWVWVGACEGPRPKPGAIAADDAVQAPELAWRTSGELAERAPIALTASDGTGLALVSLHARTVIEDPLAFTELRLTFHNPEPRRREGRFEITLPQRAAISRFAMQTRSGLQEGEVVERARAQQVYEDFLHRKQDPALLEKQAGNEFSARVFPIEAHENKQIIIAYSEELTRSEQPYRLLLSGLPSLEELNVEVLLGSSSATGKESSARARNASAKLHLQEHNFAPEADLEVRLPKQKAFALRHGELLVARVQPAPKVADAPLTGLTVLFDTSASRALGFGAQIERLTALLLAAQQRAGQDFPLRVVAFDQGVQEIYAGPVSGFGLAEQSALSTRDALGASNVAQALAYLAQQPSKHDRLLLVGDGVITAGAQDTTSLREAVARLAAHGLRRLDVLAEGGIQDQASLRALITAGLAHTGVLLDARAPLPQLASQLLGGTAARVEVKIAGASWVYPSVIEGAQAGDEVLVFAELPAGEPVQIELLGAGAQVFEALEVPRPLLQRAISRAKIEALQAEHDAWRPEAAGAAAARARLAQQIVTLSVRERVVSDHTALLVLETAADYARFGIAQNALASVLRVGDDGLELVDRHELDREGEARTPLQIAADEPRQAPAEDSWKVPAARRDQDDEPVRLRTRSTVRPSQSAQDVLAETGLAPARPRGGSVESKGGLGGIGSGTIGTRGSSGSLGAQGMGSGGGGQARVARKTAAQPRAETSKAESPAESVAERSVARAPAKAVMAAAPSPRTMQDPAAAAKPARPAAAALAMDEGQGAGYLPTRPQPASPAPTLQVAAPAQLQARATVSLRQAQGLPSGEVSSVLRSTLRARAQRCYDKPSGDEASERLVLELSISDKGSVRDAYVAGGSLSDRAAQSCILTAARALRFPKPAGANASVQAAVELSRRWVTPAPAPVQAQAARPRPRAAVKVPSPSLADAYTGTLAEVLASLARNDNAGALAIAQVAHADDPGDVMALVALGEALEASQDFAQAARAYGSLIDLFPSRTDLRRMASARLLRLPTTPSASSASHTGNALALAVDSYGHAVQQRPDHPSGHRSLAYAQWKLGDRAGAFRTLEQALDRHYVAERFEGVDRILREDLSLIASAWLRAEPGAEAQIRSALAARGLSLDQKPSLRFVLSWETDANDVDFHVYDGRGGHAYYMKPKLGSGGALYADITSGYGPECFAIPGAARAYPYVLQAHYFARGPMGYGMGNVQVVEHDGKGSLQLSEHPFVIMKDKAFVELLRLQGPLAQQVL